MNAKTLLAGSAVALALAAAAVTPAHAVVTEFATTSALTTYNVYYNNPSPGGTSPSAVFYTIATPNSTAHAAVPVSFSFINTGPILGAAVTNVTALFDLSGSTLGPAYLDPFSHKLQQYVTGAFSYVSTTPITVGTTTYAAGSTLLAGTFSDAVLSGKTSIGGLSADNDTTYGPDTLTFTSDFLAFQPTAALGLSYTLASIFPSPIADAIPGTYSLKSFRTDVGAQFTADPAPLVLGIPEPASWALMMVGFGLAGASIRRKARVQVAA
jgi:hypothetical protein